jgi:hypothetical protein
MRSLTFMALLFGMLLPSTLGQVTRSPRAATPETAKGDTVNSLSKLDAPELRYRILERFGEAFYCDPDVFPVGLSPARAEKRGVEIFPEIEKDQETLQAIYHHLGLKETATLTDEQKQLIYKEFKKLRGAVRLEKSNDQFKFNIGLKEKTGDVSIEGLINRNGAIDILKRESAVLTCPLCLAGSTQIETPTGPVHISDLRKGMLIWTADAAGNKIAAPILAVSAVIAPPAHRMVHLTLKDGRELLASPQHPTSDGRTIGQLRMGGLYDGSIVQRAELVVYEGEGIKTYDVLPAGETGFYWADGILLASTLR